MGRVSDQAIKTGFDVLLEQYGPMIFRIASSYEADNEIRADLIQDIALALWRSKDRIADAQTPKAYVARIAQNVSITHVSRAVKAPKTSLPDHDLMDDRPIVEAQLEEEQTRQRLMEAVRALPLSLRSVVTMALEGLSHKEIGLALGLTENNVGVRFSRAKQQLKMLMEGKG